MAQGHGVLPLIWLVLATWDLGARASTRRRGIEDAPAIRGYFTSALVLLTLAVGIRQVAELGLHLWVQLGDRGADTTFERRVLGLATSAMFIVVGNHVPKLLTPFSLVPPARAALLATARRFVGTGWVVLGAVTAVGFFCLPLDQAARLQLWGVIAGLLAIVGAVVWMNMAPDRPVHD